MTILVSTYVQEGIVMGTDSRLTCTDELVDGKPKNTQSDNMTKLFLLKKIPIGISSSGAAYINKNILSEYIRIFENERLDENDNIESATTKFMAYLNDTLDITNMRVQMCGYHNDVPYVYLVDRFSCQRFNTKENQDVIYNLLWNGQGEGISNLLQGQYPIKINFHLMPLKDAVDLTEFLIDLQIKFSRFNDDYSGCGGPIDILVLTPDNQYFYRHKLFNP